MRTSILILALTLVSAMSAYAQNSKQADERVIASFCVGVGEGFAKSNLSSYGVHYRDKLKSGMSYSLSVLYKFNSEFILGAKFSQFVASDNYMLNEGGAVAEDLDLYYVAPQIGTRYAIGEKWDLDVNIGVGYMYYHNKSLYEETERKCTKGFLGSNLDLEITRKVYGNLSIGVGLSLTGGNTSSLKESMGGKSETLKLDKWNKIQVVRTDLTLTLKRTF